MTGLVLGGGFLGKKISAYLGYHNLESKIHSAEDVIYILDQWKPTVVVNAIGKTGLKNIDWCEEHPKETHFSNTEIPHILAEECFKRNIYLVHISSGCIYQGDGMGFGYTEKDEPQFFGQYYSKTKVMAEHLLKPYPDVLIVRPRMPFDGTPSPRNLITKIAQYKKVIDIENSMTSVPEMLQWLGALIEKRKTGIYNFTNTGTISPYRVMELYKKIVDPTHVVEKMTLSELDAETLAKRSNCVLNSTKLARSVHHVSHVESQVIACLTKYKENLNEKNSTV